MDAQARACEVDHSSQRDKVVEAEWVEFEGEILMVERPGSPSDHKMFRSQPKGRGETQL